MPWEITVEEWTEQEKNIWEEAGLDFSKYPKFAKKFEDYHKEWHKEWVEVAIKDGKHIPERVLKDYPELQTEHIGV